MFPRLRLVCHRLPLFKSSSNLPAGDFPIQSSLNRYEREGILSVKHASQSGARKSFRRDFAAEFLLRLRLAGLLLDGLLPSRRTWAQGGTSKRIREVTPAQAPGRC